jgi:hypothetical protein
LKGGYFACLTEEAWKEMTQHLARSDRRGADFLVEKTLCFVPNAELEVSVLSSWWGTAKVRAYAGGTSLVFWTNAANINNR